LKPRFCWPTRRATARHRAVFRGRKAPKAKRVEVRFPDPTANPYLAFAAMLMAGLDGIKNKIHPGDPMDKDLYDLPPEELKDIPTVCGSLREALAALDAMTTTS
jgi:glutamine synthetase